MADGDLDTNVAIALAREGLVVEFRGQVDAGYGDLADLESSLSSIRLALESGETPSVSDVEQARLSLKRLKERLDEVDRLHGRTPWDTGAEWGELSEEDQRRVQEEEDPPERYKQG